MAEPIKRTLQLNVEKLDELMHGKFMTLEVLALKSGIDKRTLRRIRNGRSAFPSTIQEIARALKVTIRDLVVRPQNLPNTVPDARPNRFRAKLKLTGTLHSADQKEFLIRLNTKIMGALAEEGIVLTGQSFTVATSHIAGAGPLRLILAVRGVTNDCPSWFLAMIKPSMLAAFTEAEEIDASDFPFGEVIITGWGRDIPTSAIKRASALLRCKASQILFPSML